MVTMIGPPVRAYRMYQTTCPHPPFIHTVCIPVRTVRTWRRTTPMRAAEITRWGVTGLATVVSTYALDAVATAAGLLLVAAGLLAGLDQGLVLTFVAGSYLIWALGLRANVRANWNLLSTTGTSTNVLSKLAHDLTG